VQPVAHFKDKINEISEKNLVCQAIAKQVNKKKYPKPENDVLKPTGFNASGAFFKFNHFFGPVNKCNPPEPL
jgi:hypothetical protein